MYLHIENDGLGPEYESQLFLFCRTVYMAQTHCNTCVREVFVTECTIIFFDFYLVLQVIEKRDCH